MSDVDFELIITEKPSSAKKIATALADGKPIQEKAGSVPYYRITHGKQDIVIGCAVGHLYGIAEKKDPKKKKGWTYPVFDVEWKPASDVSKKSAHTKKYLNALKKIGKGAKSFTIATDYDIEGEVIGFTILHYLFKQKDGNRMKFSALTTKDLLAAYKNKSKTIDWGQAKAGVTRHELDWYYGINLSRALTSSVKAAGSFKLLSSGRVQSPALKIVVEREKEIQAFKPDPYWQIQLEGKSKDEVVIAMHKQDKFWSKDDADKVFEKTKGKPAKVSNVSRRQFAQAPPTPFDLTTLQTESYRSLRLPPKRTLEIAQELYSSGLISYPRTSSQVLPEAIDIKSIITEMAKQEFYAALCKKLLSEGKTTPNNGKKTDPAHPAIYPTGAVANIEGDKARVYDLVVRRFLATMAEAAKRETMSVKIDVNSEIFQTKGTRTVEQGWHIYYGNHVKMEEETLPPMVEGEEILDPKIEQLAKETQPPKRYTAASILKELEKRNLGTKATRASIVDTLYQRGYVFNDPLEASQLGIFIIEILEKYSPGVVDQKLTRKFEELMDEIREDKKSEQEVLDKGKEILTEILKSIRKNEVKIGEELISATRTAEREMNYIGVCPSCGGTLLMKRGKYGSFVGCDKYPDCKQTYKLPPRARIKATEKVCEYCNTPTIMVLKKAKKPQILCLNLDCPGKHSDEMEVKIEKALKKPCPTCGGELIRRQSVYGDFVGCSKYPKCNYTEKLTSPKKEEESEEVQSK